MSDNSGAKRRTGGRKSMLTETESRLLNNLERARELYVRGERCPNERTFSRRSDARWRAEDRVVKRDACSYELLEEQFKILFKRRRVYGINIADDLARLAMALLAPGSLTDQ
jgi:hypothetical protein